MQLGRALRMLRDLELELADELRRISERHAAEHDLHHLCRTLAAACEARAARLVDVAGRYGESLEGPYETGVLQGLLQTVRHLQSEVTGRTSVAGLVLLRDLRALYLAAHEVEITWTLARQAALAARDQELLQLATECGEETAVLVKWLRTRLKETAPQALVTA